MRVNYSLLLSRKIHIGLLLLTSAAMAQNAETPGDVGKVFLEFAKGKPALMSVKSALAADLKRSGTISVVASASEADAVLRADGDVYRSGYVSLNPRAGTLPHRGEPVRRGYLSVELKGKEGDTIWSYLAKTRFGSTDIERDLARQIARQLTAKVKEAKKP